MKKNSIGKARVLVGAAALGLMSLTGAGFAADQPAQGGGQTDERNATALVEGKIDAGRLYLEYCSVCHGDNGDGKSRASGGLTPPPRDFTSLDSALTLTRDRILNSIANGRPGTAMAGWSKRLSPQEISALADHIQERFMPAVSRDTLAEGRQIFAEYCSVCHGDTGAVAVWAQNGLNPPPANFTDPRKIEELTRKRMIFSVTYGRPQTAMAAWGKRLDHDQIAAVVDYVRLAFMGVNDNAVDAVAANMPAESASDPHAGGHDHDAHGLEDIGAPLPFELEGNARAGKELYLDNCTACHGEQGDGKGPRAYFIFPKPRDFSHPAARAKYSRAHLFEVISKGELGTEMPAWNKVLSEQEIGHIAEYVYRAFIRPEEESL